MMRAGYGLFALFLLGCAPELQTVSSYRDPGKPISSMAVLDQTRLDGTWHQVAGFGPSCGAAPPLKISGGGRQIDGASCFLPLQGGAAMQASGLGRFKVAGADFWLIWVDFDYRTIVIGTPSGAFGAILNRDGPIPEDRLEAARRILAFNGYDPAGLIRR